MKEKSQLSILELEKHNYTSKTMSKIERDDGVVITEQTQIMEEVETFYKNLYKQDECIEDIDLEQYLNKMKLINLQTQSLIN